MTFWWWLTQHAATTALLIAVVTIVCRLMPKRPALHHALWVVVLIKFMMPSALAWPWSVTDVRRMILPTFAINALPFAERSEAVADGPPVTSRVAPTRQEPAAASDAREQRLETPASDVAASERLIAAAKTDAISAADHASDSADVALSTSVPNRVRPAENITRWWLPLITPLVCGAWLLGGFVMGLAQLRRIRGHWRLVRRAGIAPWHLTQEIAALARELGVRPIPALVAGGITSPFVWCLGPLRVIWPEHLANEAALGRLRGVIAHELAHVRRHDHWVAWLELLVGVVWWWNPLVWFVRRRLHESAEMACDALAVSVLSDGLRAYAEAFLELSLPLRMSEPAPALGVGSRDHNSFERRLTMILSNRVASRVSSPGLLAVAVLAILATPNWSLGQIESKGAASTPSSESPQPPAKPDPDDPFGQPKPVVAAPLAAESSQPKPVSAEPKPGGNEAKSGANVEKFVTAEAELAAVKAERAAFEAERDRLANELHKLQRVESSKRSNSSQRKPAGIIEEITVAEWERDRLKEQVKQLGEFVKQKQHESGAPDSQTGRLYPLASEKASPYKARQPAMATTRALPPERDDGAFSGGAPADLTNLGIAIIEARGALRLAERRFAGLRQPAENDLPVVGGSC